MDLRALILLPLSSAPAKHLNLRSQAGSYHVVPGFVCAATPSNRGLYRGWKVAGSEKAGGDSDGYVTDSADTTGVTVTESIPKNKVCTRERARLKQNFLWTKYLSDTFLLFESKIIFRTPF